MRVKDKGLLSLDIVKLPGVQPQTAEVSNWTSGNRLAAEGIHNASEKIKIKR